jgi:toxin ParE1/3/4
VNWQVVFNPRVEVDVVQAACWYESKQPGLGSEFIAEVLVVWRNLADNPLATARRHPARNLRWRYPARFPYRILYEVDESNHTVIVLAVLHAARHPSTGL